VYTDEGEMPFQEYFVHYQCQPRVTGFRFDGVERAIAAPGVLDVIQQADLIVFCPSNPWVSIDPILAIPGIRAAFVNHAVIAISPIVDGKAIKGPAAKMYSELGIQPSCRAVAEHYEGVITGFVMDQVDKVDEVYLQSYLPHVLVTNTIMNVDQERVRLASEVIKFYSSW
jgi:LPPG:FO 2-phospho-L-lactate transferase